MKVYKFGGGILKDSQSVRKLYDVLHDAPAYNLVVVISAMAKTTNALEKLAHYAFHHDNKALTILAEIKKFHYRLLSGLSEKINLDIYDYLEGFFGEIENIISSLKSDDFDFYYDQIVSFGELISSRIVSSFLNGQGLQNIFLDVRKVLITDSNYRSANVNMPLAVELVNENIVFDKNKKIYITQGFIGSDEKGHATTLGREGSDYTAALFSATLGAEELVLWKDVPGIFNADPKKYLFSVKIPALSYTDAEKLTNLGAKVIHSKTIGPLKEKKIPAEVRLFGIPVQPGTIISNKFSLDPALPLVITMENKAMLIFDNLDSESKDISALIELLSHEHHCIRTFNYLCKQVIFIMDNDPENIKEIQDKYSVSYEILCRCPVDILTLRNLGKQELEIVLSGSEVLYNFFEDGYHILILLCSKNRNADDAD